MNWLLVITLVLTSPVPAQPTGTDSNAPPPRQPGPATPPATTTFDQKLEELDARIALIKDLSADFEQEKRTPLLRKPLVSSGTVKVKGPRTRWDTTKPRPSTMTIDASELKLYYPEQKAMEIYPVAGGMAELAASPLPSNRIIREHFSVTEVPAIAIDPRANEGALGVKLVPLKESLREHVEQVRVVIDASTGIGRVVEITDADGEVTIMRFTNVKTDTGLRDDDVELKAPPGTKVSRPLQGEAPRTEAPGTPAEPTK